MDNQQAATRDQIRRKILSDPAYRDQLRRQLLRAATGSVLYDLGYGQGDDPELDQLHEMTIDEFGISEIYDYSDTVDQAEAEFGDPGPGRIAVALVASGTAIISYSVEGQWISRATKRIDLEFVADFDNELEMHNPSLLSASETRAD